MSREEVAAYRHYLDNHVILADQIYTARGKDKLEGRQEELEEGRKEGIAEATMAHARIMKEKGISSAIISEVTGMSIGEVESLT